MSLDLEYLIRFIENHVEKFEREIYSSFDEIKKQYDVEKVELVLKRIEILISYLSSIYLSFNTDLKEVLNQRIGQKEKLFQILKDFDRVDDLEYRRVLIKRIKEGFYEK